MIPDDVRRVARRAGGLFAVGGLAGLAGCNDATQQGATGATTSSDAGTDASTDSSDSGGSSGPSNTDQGGTSGGGTTSGSDCHAKVEEYYAELDEVEIAIANLEYEAEDLATAERGLTLLAKQLEEGFPEDTMETAKSVGDAARESVVYINAILDGEMLGSGTGWYISDHEVVTNAHVVKDSFTMETADELEIFQFDGEKYEGYVVGAPEFTQPDIALVETSGSGTPLPVHTDRNLEEGQPLVQVGHPGGVGNWYVTMGMFVTREHWEIPDGAEYYDIKTTVPGTSGVSGSPVMDLQGRVVGLTWGASPPWQRQFGDRPVVAPDVVYDAPLVEIGISDHLGADGITEYVEGWR